MRSRNCGVRLRHYTDAGPKRNRLRNSPSVPLISGTADFAGRSEDRPQSRLWHQPTRHGLRADLAITVDAARSFVGYKDYHVVIAIVDLSTLQTLPSWRQLREAAPRTWMIDVARTASDPTGRLEPDFGVDVCLPTPFRFSDLLARLALFSHQRRGLCGELIS